MHPTDSTHDETHVALSGGNETPSGGRGLAPISNDAPGRIQTLDDLALCDIGLGDFPVVAAWRRKLFDPEWIPELCDELPRLLTESMRESDGTGTSPYTRRANALAHVFRQKTPLVRDTDLMPGQTTTSFVGPVIYPDMIGYCIWPELNTVSKRRQNPFKVKPEVARRLNREIFPYWMERRALQEIARYSDYNTENHAEEVDRIDGGKLPDGSSSIDPPLKKRAGQTPKCQELFERVAFFLSDKATCVSHTVPDFERLLSHGLDGLIRQARADLEESAPKSDQQRELLEGVITVFEGSKVYAQHLADAAVEVGNDELARICRKVPAGPADTLHEALVSVWVCYHLLLQENTNFGFSVARLDQLVNKYYLSDWQELATAEERHGYTKRAVELVCHFFLRCSDHVPLSTSGSEKLFAGSGSNQALTVGGTRYENGQVVDAVNDMTYVILKATEILAIRDPNIHARYHKEVHARDPEGNPLPAGQIDSYMRRLCQVNIQTRATPAIHGDVPAIKAMSDYYAAHDGTTRDEALTAAHDYASIGCIEQNASSCHYGNTGSTLFVLPAVLELTVYGGKHRSSGTGPNDPNLFSGRPEYTTRPLWRMETMDEFIEAFRFQLDEMARHTVQNNNYLGRSMARHRASPLLSGLFVGPTNLPGKSGASFRDVASGGAKFNSSGVTMIGLADVIDSFCAIENLVFGDKVSADEMLAAMDADFDVSRVAGESEHRSWISTIIGEIRDWFDDDDGPDLSPERLAEIVEGIRLSPKYGAGVSTEVGSTYDNRLAVHYTHLIPKILKEVFYKYRNHRGGRYLVGYWSMTNHAGFGMLTKATPNGRREGEAFAGGITPCPGVVKRNGDPVTLLDHMLSVAEVDGDIVQNGYTYNLSLTTRGPGQFGEDTERFGHYMRTFMDEEGLLVQMCVSSLAEFRRAHAAATAMEREDAGEADEAALAPYKDLMIRVAGYSAYFVTLSEQMRKEIIDRANFSLRDGEEQHAAEGSA